jgi:uncharacterized protein YecT (DUF1311 family)
MRVIKLIDTSLLVIAFLLLSQITPAMADKSSIYSGIFDYHKFVSSDEYFSDRSKQEIDEFCKKLPQASQSDMDQCVHRDFEASERELKESLARVTTTIRKGDIELKTYGEPAALSWFIKSQDAWVQYRDNYCYSHTYIDGGGSGRYSFFWDCMTKITKDHIQQLNSFFSY